MQNLSDENLIQRFQQGDEAAFAQLVSRYEKELYRYLVRFLGNSTLAEDVFQEAFLQVHLSASTFDTTRTFKPWLYTIASNKARDLLRSQSRRSMVNIGVTEGEENEQDIWNILLQDHETPERIFDKEQDKEQVHRILSAMPVNLREILLLAYFKQLSYKEIAEMLAIPLGTVKSRLHGAVAAFARLYQQSNEEDTKKESVKP